MVVINPEQCIDCGVCVPECPIDAIKPDTVDGAETWVEFNQKYAQLWPNITVKGIPPVDADTWVSIPDKLPHHFDPEPGDTNATQL